MKYLSIDFEYRKTNQARLDLVACALTDGSKTRSIWLHNDLVAKEKLKNFLLKVRDTHVLLAYNVDAEGRSLVSLGLNPIKFKWIDLQAEWKHLTNHNDRLGYGKQFIDGKFKNTSRKTWDDDDKKPHNRTPTSLLACTYKLLGTGSEEEYKRKKEMRDLILYTAAFDEDDKRDILDYCSGDIKDLYAIYEAQLSEYIRLGIKYTKHFHREQLWRGETVARAAVIASIGYPVNREKVVNFTKNIPSILREMQDDINEQFPEMELFRKTSKKATTLSLNTKAVKAWIEGSEYAGRWLKTPTKEFSLKLEVFEKHFAYRHDFPRDNFPAQFLRWLKTNKALNGFKPKSATAKNKDTFFSYYGSDDRAHPYLNAYGSQSARYQPKATGFMHLKAAWMRSMVEPKPGTAICAIDYGSEEFLLAALMSGDKNMIEAYRSGDVYLYFAKLAGAVPWDGSKKDYAEERNAFKATTLGISYQMGPVSLAAKLTTDTGKKHDVDDARELIWKFNQAYPDYHAWIQDNEARYRRDGYLRLADGWHMWGDNHNMRSVGNFPIQGMGSVILRKAIQLSQDAGVKIILPLHDAGYGSYPSRELEEVDTFASCMRGAFAFPFINTNEKYKLARDLIRLDINVWSPDYEDGTFTTPGGLTGKQQKIYIDERSEAEYARFSKYFEADS